jgi:hypothetical protein
MTPTTTHRFGGLRRRSVLIPILAGLTIMATALPAAARSPIAIGIANPDGGPGATAVTKNLDEHVRKVGVNAKPHLWALWTKWGSRGGHDDCRVGAGTCAFPSEAVAALHKRKVTPVIWWEPTDPANPDAGRYESFRRMLDGHHDAYIRQWARDAKAAGKASGRPVIVRFAHEAVGRWFPWSIGRHGNTRTNYKAAWRYVWGIFREEGALPHARFMWANVYPFAWAYPGDRYVSYVGLTILNFGSSREWRAARGMLDERVRAASKFSSRPVIVAEMATNHIGGNKARWLEQAYDHAYRKLPRVKGIMYLDTDEPARDQGQPDWRLVKPDDGSAMRAYRAIASSARFKGYIR